MNKRTLKRAIGVSDGKALTIANDCAECVISLVRLEHLEHNLRREVVVYDVSGDVPDAGDKRFDTLPAALPYALEGLALYMDGSPNR